MPASHNFAISNLHDSHARHYGMFACGRDAAQWADLGAAESPAIGHAVALGHDIVEGELAIGHGGQLGAMAGLHLFGCDGHRFAGVVQLNLCGKNFVSHVYIAGVELVEQTLDEGFIVFSGHEIDS